MPGLDPPPPEERKRERKECRPDQTPWWKHLLELAAVLLGIAVVLIDLETRKAKLARLVIPCLNRQTRSTSSHSYLCDPTLGVQQLKLGFTAIPHTPSSHSGT
jgi:hypothetical protein